MEMGETLCMFVLADNFKFHWGENHDMLVELVACVGEIQIAVALNRAVAAARIQGAVEGRRARYVVQELALELAAESTLVIQSAVRSTQTRLWMAQAMMEVNTLSQLFLDADATQDGSLDHDELAHVLKDYYKTNGISKNKASVAAALKSAMQNFDLDSSGSLELGEFIAMVGTSKEFAFNRGGVGAKSRVVMDMVAQIGTGMAQDKHLQGVAAEILQAGISGADFRLHHLASLRQDEAASVLQGLCVGAVERANAAAAEEAVVQVQGLMRGHAGRQDVALAQGAQAALLQAGCLGVEARRGVQDELVGVQYGMPAVAIQAAIRGKEDRTRAMLQLEDGALSAAAIIQAMFRGRDDREAFVDMRDETYAASCSTLLAGLEGRFTRQVVGEEVGEERNQSAAQLRAMVAGCHAREFTTVEMCAEEGKAASRAQAALRSRRERDLLSETLKRLDKEAAAQLIQSVLSSHADRLAVEAGIALAYDGAAHTLQSGLQGFITRRVVGEERSEMEAAATARVNAIHLARGARTSIEEVHDMNDHLAARLVQARLRGRDSRMGFVAMLRGLELSEAACLVQGLLRGHNDRAVFTDIQINQYEAAAASLQGGVEGLSTRRRQLRSEEAASLVQAIIRGKDDREAAGLLYTKHQQLTESNSKAMPPLPPSFLPSFLIYVSCIMM